jgi:MoaA/NifB/PqqE/SkfB family radical SAM enzyme
LHKKNIKTAHLIIDSNYPAIKRYHFLNIQRTASALRHPDLLIDEDEALDFWLRLNEHAKSFPADLFLPSLRIQMRALGRSDVDPERSLHREATFDCGVCSAGWTNVNITADFNVLGCDIAKDFTGMGNCMNRSFAEIWNSAEANLVRSSAYPACYKIKGPTGESLEDYLQPQFSPKQTLYQIGASSSERRREL